MDYLAFRLFPSDGPTRSRSHSPSRWLRFHPGVHPRPTPGVLEGTKINGEELDTSGPTIFEAVKQQLGLELTAQKGPVEVIVIDNVERPTGN
jgi:uncharacterized protein (TIGR03435 family)